MVSVRVESTFQDYYDGEFKNGAGERVVYKREKLPDREQFELLESLHKKVVQLRLVDDLVAEDVPTNKNVLVWARPRKLLMPLRVAKKYYRMHYCLLADSVANTCTEYHVGKYVVYKSKGSTVVEEKPNMVCGQNPVYSIEYFCVQNGNNSTLVAYELNTAVCLLGTMVEEVMSAADVAKEVVRVFNEVGRWQIETTVKS